MQNGSVTRWTQIIGGVLLLAISTGIAVITDLGSRVTGVSHQLASLQATQLIIREEQQDVQQLNLQQTTDAAEAYRELLQIIHDSTTDRFTGEQGREQLQMIGDIRQNIARIDGKLAELERRAGHTEVQRETHEMDHQ